MSFNVSFDLNLEALFLKICSVMKKQNRVSHFKIELIQKFCVLHFPYIGKAKLGRDASHVMDGVIKFMENSWKGRVLKSDM